MARPVRRTPIIGSALAWYRERLTARGRYLFVVMAGVALLGMDTRQTQVFRLFAVAAALFLAASVFAMRPKPKVRIDCALPFRATTLTPLTIRARLAGERNVSVTDLHFSFPRPRVWGGSISFSPREVFVSTEADKPAEVSVTLQAARRGQYLLRGPAVRFTDPLRLAVTNPTALPDQTLLVYPRYYTMPEFIVPLGRRYQPGGIPLSSSTGDAIEFIGTREYREGDPLKNIHWKSWARVGKPVVKEFQEEYFCRIAIILDTFLPRKATKADQTAFEAAISVVASIADYFSRSEYIVDILAAGPDIYEVSAGRSLAYLENILDVLACIEPCYEPPFQTIGPTLFEKLGQITTVVAVVLDWDAPREEFLRRVKTEGAAVRALIVREQATNRPWQDVGEELGELSVLTPDDVERLLVGKQHADAAKG